jgi:hypothetical protein
VACLGSNDLDGLRADCRGSGMIWWEPRPDDVREWWRRFDDQQVHPVVAAKANPRATMVDVVPGLRLRILHRRLQNSPVECMDTAIEVVLA